MAYAFQKGPNFPLGLLIFGVVEGDEFDDLRLIPQLFFLKKVQQNC